MLLDFYKICEDENAGKILSPEEVNTIVLKHNEIDLKKEMMEIWGSALSGNSDDDVCSVIGDFLNNINFGVDKWYFDITDTNSSFTVIHNSKLLSVSDIWMGLYSDGLTRERLIGNVIVEKPKSEYNIFSSSLMYSDFIKVQNMINTDYRELKKKCLDHLLIDDRCKRAAWYLNNIIEREERGRENGIDMADPRININRSQKYIIDDIVYYVCNARIFDSITITMTEKEYAKAKIGA